MTRPKVKNLAAALQKITSVIGLLDVVADLVTENKLDKFARGDMRAYFAFQRRRPEKAVRSGSLDDPLERRWRAKAV